MQRHRRRRSPPLPRSLWALFCGHRRRRPVHARALRHRLRQRPPLTRRRRFDPRHQSPTPNRRFDPASPSPPVHPHPHFLFADSIPTIWFKVIYAAGIRWHSILRWPSFSLLALISSPTELSRFHVERSSYRMFALQ